MPNYGYHLARAEGRAVRTIYRALLPSIARRRAVKRADFPIDVVAYSGEETLPEQVASICSFLKHVGQPRQFTIVSDGTLTRRGCAILKSLNPAVSVSGFEQWLPKNLPSEIYPYLTSYPTGKQLAVIMSLPAERPTLYIDSDVLFFAGATDLFQLLEKPRASALYLADCQLSADERLIRGEAEKGNPVNTGALLLFEKLDWAPAVRRFSELKGPPNFFTNQTMTHLTMHANRAFPLDDQKYVLRLDDQFVYGDWYAGRDLALRHYVNPVRHKFWTTFFRRLG